MRHALLGINQLLDEDTGNPDERPPGIVQPVAYQFLRVFGSRSALPRDEVGKSLRGTGITRKEFELTRALMVVPAGLVENWRRELNDTFHLDFEVFGSEGDVTDRKTNAFAKHNRLIASIDTLKRPARVKRLLQAPPWDLIVFDEAHHLTAYRGGNKVTRTHNFKLAEELRGHSREPLATGLRDLAPAHESLLPVERRAEWVRSVMPEMIRRELTHTGLLGNEASLSVRLLAWVELV